MKTCRLIATLFATGWFGLTLAAPALTPLDPTLTAPLKLNDLQGKAVSLQDFRGKVVLINFWATYCKPCREEMPSLERLKGRLGTRGLSVLGVAVAEEASVVSRFLSTTPVSFPILLDGEAATMAQWKAIVLPSTYLVDRRGRLRARLVGGTDWESPVLVEALEKLLNE
jgi:thiol-disulfide isomerase/thioredoxin